MSLNTIVGFFVPSERPFYLPRGRAVVPDTVVISVSVAEVIFLSSHLAGICAGRSICCLVLHIRLPGHIEKVPSIIIFFFIPGIIENVP